MVLRKALGRRGITTSALLAAVVAVACSIIAGRAVSAQNSANVPRARLATAYVETASGKSATAFCIDPAGYFVTDSRIADREPVSLVLNPAEVNQTIVSAAVVAVDSNARLAVLKTYGGAPYTALNLGETGRLFETNTVTTLGYPFGRTLAANAKGYPAVTVTVGRITSLVRQASALSQIRIDTPLTPGSAGGPVLNDRGDVVGIISGGDGTGTTLNAAIPVEKLRAFIAKPAFVFLPPTSLSFKNSVAPIDWTVEVWAMPRLAKVPAYMIELTLPGTNASRKFLLKADGPNRYTVSAPAVEPLVEAARVRVSAFFADGTITGEFLDREAQVAGRTVMLSEIAMVDRDDAGTVTLLDGTVIRGAFDGPTPAQLDVNRNLVNVDLAAARRLLFSAPTREPSRQPVSYSLNITETATNSTVARPMGTIPLIRGATVSIRPPIPDIAETNVEESPRISEPSFSGTRLNVPLPAPADDVILARRGRFVLLLLQRLRYVAIFDVNLGKITDFIPVPSDRAKIAASADKLFVLNPDNRQLERWNLLTLKREQTMTLDVTAPYGLAMGYASNGPLMVSTPKEPVFIAPDTLGRLPVQIELAPEQEFFPTWGDRLMTQASADGLSFAARIVTTEQNIQAITANRKGSVTVKGNGGRLLRLEGNVGTEYYLPSTKGALLPSYDASNVFTGAGILSSKLKPVSPGHLEKFQCLPSTSTAFFACLAEEQSRPQPGGASSLEMVQWRLEAYDSDARQPLASLGSLDELTSVVSRYALGVADEFPLEKRVFLVPQANLLITLPRLRDQLILRRFDVVAEAVKGARDYLFVTSVPPRIVKAGAPIRYAIEIKSKKGSVVYRLESGPPGMNLDANGLLSWNAPGNVKSPVPVDISITDGSGKEIHHTFAITVKQ
jgi:hypothetical protein